jgi:fructokinase
MSNQPLIFGEVLFDHFPDGSRVLGGAPFNVAWHLQAFGLAPQFISRVGNDVEGQEIIELMTAWNMSLDSLQHDNQHPTGSVQVHIEHGEPHYDIVENSGYDFISADLLSHSATQGILYHGSLALRNPVSRAALNVLKAQHQGKIFIDINLRAPWWQKDDLLPLLHDAHWVKLNEHELAEFYHAPDLMSASKQFAEQFNLEILFVTCGAQGAIAWHNLEQQLFSIKPTANIQVVDTVGAGDAFASVLLLGLTRQWAIQDTLERAQTFASEIVCRRGATVADKTFYQGIVEQWC